jgi:hypothetical protein
MTIADAEDTVRFKLPLRRTIALSYSSYFHHFADVLRISWLWMLAAGMLTAVASWLQAGWLQALAEIRHRQHRRRVAAAIDWSAGISRFRRSGRGVRRLRHRSCLASPPPAQ